MTQTPISLRMPEHRKGFTRTSNAIGQESTVYSLKHPSYIFLHMVENILVTNSLLKNI